MPGESVSVGFGAAPINGCFEERADYYEDLEARLLYLRGSGEQCLLVSLDVVHISRFLSRRIRQALATRLKMSPDQVITHVTHTHTAPNCDALFLSVGLDRLLDRLTPAARQARASATPCRIALTTAHAGRHFSVNERAFVPGVGAFEAWYGYRVADGRADGAPVVRPRVEEMLGRPLREGEFPKELWYDAPIDDEVHLLQFESPAGRPIGTILRFSVHPIASGHCPRDQWRYGPDSPGAARQRVEEGLGGVCLYLSGPHGNITALEDVPWRWDAEKGSLVHADADSPWREARRLGRGVAELALHAARDGSDFVPLRRLAVVTSPVRLPLRESVLLSPQERHESAERLEAQLAEARRRDAGLPVIKELAEQVEHFRCADVTQGTLRACDESEIAAGSIEYEMPAVGINDISLVGFPGETFCDTGQAVSRAVCPARVITITEANGGIGYIPTPEEFPRGGYHVRNSLIAPQAERILRQEAIRLADSVTGPAES